MAFSPTVKPIADLLQLPEDTIRQVLRSWGPGRYDAIFDKDGKAFRPDGKTAAVVIPPAFGLAGSNLHTYTGWGSVPDWNAYVAVTEMHGQGTFVDTRLNDAVKFPVAVRSGSWNVRSAVDLVTAKLPALHFYQLSLAAPTPPEGSFDAADVGIDNFHADRSPTSGYRTTPLKGLFAREKRGFYHDGRFADYAAVVEHYKPVLGFQLTSAEQNDLIQFLKSLWPANGSCGRRRGLNLPTVQTKAQPPRRSPAGFAAARLADDSANDGVDSGESRPGGQRVLTIRIRRALRTS